MRLTAKMKAWAVENLGVEKDADDQVYRDAIAAAIANGKMTMAKCAELQLEDGDDPQAAITKTVSDQVAAAVAPINEAVSKLVAATTKAPADPPPKAPEPAPENMQAMIDNAVKAAIDSQPKVETPASFSEQVIARATQVNVIPAVDRYSTTKTALCFPKTGRRGMPHPLAEQQMVIHNQPQDAPSEREQAACGAWLQYKIACDAPRKGLISFREEDYPQHLKDLIQYALHELEWVGSPAKDGENRTRVFCGRLDEQWRKAVIDDTTSGGSYMVPVPMGMQVVQAPTLTGEVLPLVTIVPIDRGSSVDGSTLGAVTITSDHTEGSAITLETTTGLITETDTSIFPAVGGIELGLDFLSDTPINVMQLLIADYSRQLQAWLDNQICNGDGTTEPEGIFTKSGVTSVSHTGGTSAAFTVDDFEKLMFGVNKATRAAFPGRTAFISSELMYRRAKAVPVGAADVRRALGMDHQSYQIMDTSCRIQDTIASGSIGYCQFGFYRLYQRQGLQIRTVTEGATLARANTLMIVMRARFGGQLVYAPAMAKMTNGPQTG